MGTAKMQLTNWVLLHAGQVSAWAPVTQLVPMRATPSGVKVGGLLGYLVWVLHGALGSASAVWEPM